MEKGRFLWAMLVLLIGVLAPARAPAQEQACTNPYGCAHDSRKTGPQARKPEQDVYCQIQDGKPDRGPYNKTGKQIPCGPAFQKQPPPKKPPPESCPVVLEKAEHGVQPVPLLMAGAMAAAGIAASQHAQAATEAAAKRWPGAGLYIGTKEVKDRTDVAGLKEFLAQGDPDFRLAVYTKMKCHRHRRFEFASADDLKTNIKIREAVVRMMDKVRTGHLNVSFASYNFQMPADSWGAIYVDRHFGGGVRIRRGLTFSTLTFATHRSKTASEAITAFLGSKDMTPRLECLMGLQMIVLSGVRDALGADAFDALHPASAGTNALFGIGVPILDNGKRPSFKTSPNRHLVPVRWTGRMDGDPSYIAVADMVPGDYAYISNPESYQIHHPNGPWAGENTIYMKSGLFYGLGLGTASGTETGFESEDQLKDKLVKNHNVGLAPGDHITAERTRWTLLAAPVRDGEQREAGLFMTPGR